MIWISFGKWQSYSCEKWVRTRILIKGYIWTPFVRVRERYTGVELMKKIADLQNQYTELVNDISVLSTRLESDERQIDNIGNAVLACDREVLNLKDRIA